MDYEVIYQPTGAVAGIRRSDGASIPFDLDNRDFREFLSWNAAQPQPLDYLSPIQPRRTWDMIRAERDQLLRSCDWTQLPDATLTADEREAWAIYRQALRDLPQVYGDPDSVIYPEKPA